ncbi:hypothetical protein BDQ17DRAFT_1381074, partial [Cyathus striatus]
MLQRQTQVGGVLQGAQSIARCMLGLVVCWHFPWRFPNSVSSQLKYPTLNGASTAPDREGNWTPPPTTAHVQTIFTSTHARLSIPVPIPPPHALTICTRGLGRIQKKLELPLGNIIWWRPEREGIRMRSPLLEQSEM